MQNFPKRFAILLICLPVLSSTICADDWPQWRGPKRTNISEEKNLLATWPDGGPPLAWEATGLGDGVVPVSVAGGRVYCTGYKEDDEYCSALYETDGSLVWSVRIGPAVKESQLMRWLSQRTPTVDAERVYVVTVLGDYICLESETGKEIWRRNAVKDFESKPSVFGFCDYPLVDGDRLIISPGGPSTTIAALDKRTGEVVWRCGSKEINGPAHASLTAAEIGGVRQYVNTFMNGLIGVRASDGELLWQFPHTKLKVAVSHSPVVDGDTIFYASGYVAGHLLIKISPAGERFTAAEVYSGKGRYLPWLGSLTQIDNHIFVNSLKGVACIDRSSGEISWEAELSRNTYTVADGRLYILTQTGKMLLVGADVKEYRPLSEFTPFETMTSQSGVSFPVVANGRLYVRDLDKLRSFDIRDNRPPTTRVPDAVFVPTPEDVVPQLLELAKIQESDLVFDLGSGDGRIIIAAAKKYGCHGVGIEVNEDLVALAKAAAAEAGVSEKTKFEHKDLFESDFSKASVLTLYILPEMLQRLVPRFNKLQSGSRIVSHEFAIPGIEPNQVVEVTSEEDGQTRSLYFYTIPLKPNAVK